MVYEEFELRIYGIPATLLLYVPRLCEVFTALSDLPRTCYEFLSAHIKKRSTSAYEEYELRIEECELCTGMLTMYDIRVTYLLYLYMP